jgi:hypothetical protein
MRPMYSALLLFDSLLFGQTSANTIAERMLARIDGAQWPVPFTGSKSAACQPRTLYQQAFGANGEFTEHCVSRAGGLLEESFFYAFDESGPVRLKMEVRPEPPADVEIARALRERLTKRFGAPTHEANMIEIGLPFAGDHWVSDKRYYFLFQNPSGMPLGISGAVLLIVLDSRLFNEIRKDALVQQADADPARPFLERLVGDYYGRLIDAYPKTSFKRDVLAKQTSREALDLLGVANRALLDERAMLLLAANGLITKLSTLLWEVDSETAPAGLIRLQLAKFGVKLGGILHDGGLAYNQDLLWRVWREFPDSQAGQLAFVELQQHGWYTNPGIDCPANPDLFHDVIEHGEAFLVQHPATPFRKEVLFTLAAANESWWSIAHAPAGDPFVGDIPYPRKNLNKQKAAAARERAIDYYEQIVTLAPESPEAASAERQLPRLKLALDTGQRRFFCSYD